MHENLRTIYDRIYSDYAGFDVNIFLRDGDHITGYCSMATPEYLLILKKDKPHYISHVYRWIDIKKVVVLK